MERAERGQTHVFHVNEGMAGARLDAILSDYFPEYSRSYLQKLIKTGMVKAGEKKVRAGMKPSVGMEISVLIPPLEPASVKAQDIPLDVVYEDEYLLVVNKACGMVVHPAPGNPDGTLVNALLHHCGESLSGIGGVVRPGIVHRIDKNTTGLLAVAKTDQVHQSLSDQLREHSMRRRYSAVVGGEFKESSGMIDLPIGRDPNQREKMWVNFRAGRHAISHYDTELRLDGVSLMNVELETGRTHQIRVHMRYVGHPVIGDPQYGLPWQKSLRNVPMIWNDLRALLKKARTQLLHARALHLRHPVLGRDMEFEAPYPPLFEQILASMREKYQTLL